MPGVIEHIREFETHCLYRPDYRRYPGLDIERVVLILNITDIDIGVDEPIIDLLFDKKLHIFAFRLIAYALQYILYLRVSGLDTVAKVCFSDKVITLISRYSKAQYEFEFLRRVKAYDRLDEQRELLRTLEREFLTALRNSDHMPEKLD